MVMMLADWSKNNAFNETKTEKKKKTVKEGKNANDDDFV